MVWLSPAAAAVYSPKQALSAPVIQDFLANPGALLTKYPVGGAQLISRVRDLAASDPSTLNQSSGCWRPQMPTNQPPSAPDLAKSR